MREKVPFRIITDAENNPAGIHITTPHLVGEESVVQIVEKHMFGQDPKVAVLMTGSRRRNQRLPVIDPIDLQQRFGRDRGIRIAALRIINSPLGAIIRPPAPSTYF